MGKNTVFKRHTGHYFPHDFTKRQKETDLGCDRVSQANLYYRRNMITSHEGHTTLIENHRDLTYTNHSHAGRVVGK